MPWEQVRDQIGRTQSTGFQLPETDIHAAPRVRTDAARNLKRRTLRVRNIFDIAHEPPVRIISIEQLRPLRLEVKIAPGSKLDPAMRDPAVLLHFERTTRDMLPSVTVSGTD